MPRYSVATTKDNLSKLIDKALAGEEVIITRHGKPTVKLRAVQPPRIDRATMMEWLRKRRESRSAITITGVELKRLDQKEAEH